MEELSFHMPPHEYVRFVKEGVVVRHLYLMHSMKVKCCLTHGYGFNDSVLTQWILSGSGCLKLCGALEKLFGKTLAIMSRAFKVSEKIMPVKPRPLFVRIICVMMNESDLIPYLKFELAPRPPALFEEISMRKTAKSVYLLHSFVWPRPATFGQICEAYVTFVQKHFSLTTVFFRGHAKCTTKGKERRWRYAGRSSADISIAANNVFTSLHVDFLKNHHSKNWLMNLLLTNFRASDHRTIQCSGDSDITIAAVAYEYRANCGVRVISTYTNILAMLIAREYVGKQLKLSSHSQAILRERLSIYLLFKESLVK
ncbi:hypothetical protein PR048_014454 [Dryococelus australis]|uniref:Uncharacterized protein n=1 Tax=Dryococelus australis TaxID=614101 RepID=A0ABQ9HE97_9NEOP|nr:hypothetical protein PR048_014454 [Dryococelus australis]